jgi:predicted ATPase
MITDVEISNFKCFRRLRLPFGALTLLTGFNGGGKSTALQPLLLLSQWNSPTKGQRVAVNGRLVSLGTPGDVLPPNASTSNVTFSVSTEKLECTWTLAARSGDRTIAVADVLSTFKEAPKKGSDSLIELGAKLQSIIHVSAIREGTSDYYATPPSEHRRKGDVGVDGRFAAYWYDQNVDEEIEPRRRHRGERGTSLRKQLDAWMGTLFPGAQANVQALPQVLLYSLQFRLTETGEWRRPANVGYGFTYAFPIIVALLVAETDSVIVIDSPEAHLHPAAQSEMGRLLAHFAAAGIQIILETHSDHLLNGVRLAVRDKQLAPKDLKMHFFTGATRDGEHGVVSPSIDVNGRIDEWPQGFFDQSEKDLAQLTSW